VYALASLQELKDYLPAHGDTEDDGLTKALNRASAILEARTDRHFVTRGELTEYHSVYDGRRLLELSQAPVISITSIHESASLPPVYDADSLLVPEEDYLVDRERGLVDRVCTGIPIGWASGRRAIRVVWSYGYRSHPLAGSLFVCRPGASGRPTRACSL
jgi:hypothetical protein